MRRNGGRLQVFPECGHYPGRHRTCPSDTQETILLRARSISELRVTKANLGSSTRVALRLRASPRMCRPDRPEPPISSAFNAPVPTVLRTRGSGVRIPSGAFFTKNRFFGSPGHEIGSALLSSVGLAQYAD